MRVELPTGMPFLIGWLVAATCLGYDDYIARVSGVVVAGVTAGVHAALLLKKFFWKTQAAAVSVKPVSGTVLALSMFIAVLLAANGLAVAVASDFTKQAYYCCGVVAVFYCTKLVSWFRASRPSFRDCLAWVAFKPYVATLVVGSLAAVALFVEVAGDIFVKRLFYIVFGAVPPPIPLGRLLLFVNAALVCTWLAAAGPAYVLTSTLAALAKPSSAAAARWRTVLAIVCCASIATKLGTELLYGPVMEAGLDAERAESRLAVAQRGNMWVFFPVRGEPTRTPSMAEIEVFGAAPHTVPRKDRERILVDAEEDAKSAQSREARACAARGVTPEIGRRLAQVASVVGATPTLLLCLLLAVSFLPALRIVRRDGLAVAVLGMFSSEENRERVLGQAASDMQFELKEARLRGASQHTLVLIRLAALWRMLLVTPALLVDTLRLK